MRPRFYGIIGCFILLFALINYYIGWHGQLFIRYTFDMDPGPVYWICFWIVAFSYLLGRLGGKFLPHSLAVMLKWIGSYWMAVMLFTFVMLPFADVVAGVMALLSFESSFTIPVIGAVVSVVLLFLMIRGSWNARNPIVRRYEISIPKSAGQRKELRIAIASDLHLGTIVGNKQLNVLVDKMNALEPDLILFPGDIIDDDIKPFIRYDMGSVMKRLKSKLGIYAVLGNHEYIGGHIKEFVNQMSSIGIEVLLDRSVLIEDSFYVIGRKDKAVERFGSDGRMDLELLLAGLDKSKPLILMDHQPYGLDKAAAAGVDVMLSGHTHRGQMAPNHFITRRIFELDWGYLKKGALHAIVSSGYGTWGPPVRIGSRSELIELVVRFEG